MSTPICDVFCERDHLCKICKKHPNMNLPIDLVDSRYTIIREDSIDPSFRLFCNECFVKLFLTTGILDDIISTIVKPYLYSCHKSTTLLDDNCIIFGVNNTIEKLGDIFLENKTLAIAYQMNDDSSTKINECYTNKFKKLIPHQSEIVEQLMIPKIVEIVDYFLSKEYSVIITLKYTSTRNKLADQLSDHLDIKVPTIYHNNTIHDFSENKSRILVTTLKILGGADFSDKIGTHPRVSIITDLQVHINIKRVTSKINRFGCKSNYRCRIVYPKNNFGLKLMNSAFKNYQKLMESEKMIMNAAIDCL